MWNRLISVVEEQVVTWIRTAFSTSVRELATFCRCLQPRRLPAIAQAALAAAPATPCGGSGRHFITLTGRENIYSGDLYQRPMESTATVRLHGRVAELPQG